MEESVEEKAEGEVDDERVIPDEEMQEDAGVEETLVAVTDAQVKQGTIVVVTQDIPYKRHTLTTGLRGAVTKMGKNGDALVQWNDGSQRWVQKKDLTKINVVALEDPYLTQVA